MHTIAAWWDASKQHYLAWFWWFWVVTYFLLMPLDYANAKSLIEIVAGLGLLAFFVQLAQHKRMVLGRGEYITIGIIGIFILAAIYGYSQHVDAESSRKFFPELKTSIIAIALVLTPLPRGIKLRKILIIALYGMVVASCMVFFYNYYYHGITRPGIGSNFVISTINVLVIALWLLWCIPPYKGLSKLVIFVPVWILASWCIVLSETRGAWLNYLGLIAILLLMSIHGIKQKLLGLAVICLIASSLYFVPTIHGRVDMAFEDLANFDSARGDAAHTSLGIRLFIWEKSIEELKDDPIFARGYKDINTFLEISENSFIYNLHLYQVHNELLQQWLQKGLIGLIAIVLMLGLPLMAAPVSLTTLVLSVGVVLAGLTNCFLWRNYPLIFYLVFFVLWLKVVSQDKLEAQRDA